MTSEAAKTEQSKAKVFISYSRKDLEFGGGTDSVAMEEVAYAATLNRH